ncbi:MAG TPA: hypothetical protein DCP22_07365 [Ruminococcaceae bacterium]|nr:hypothetical protein [Oscillospiraceae bacterium]
MKSVFSGENTGGEQLSGPVLFFRFLAAGRHTNPGSVSLCNFHKEFQDKTTSIFLKRLLLVQLAQKTGLNLCNFLTC